MNYHCIYINIVSVFMIIFSCAKYGGALNYTQVIFLKTLKIMHFKWPVAVYTGKFISVGFETHAKKNSKVILYLKSAYIQVYTVFLFYNNYMDIRILYTECYSYYETLVVWLIFKGSGQFLVWQMAILQIYKSFLKYRWQLMWSISPCFIFWWKK